MYDLIKTNYTELLNNYCKYKNKTKINNSCNCEDNFNDKMLKFMQLELEEPTLDLLKIYIQKGNRKTKNKFIEYKDYMDRRTDEEIEFEIKLKLLFINYRPEKKNNN